MKLSNPELTVIAAGGDGDGYAIGMGHFMHAFKKNASFLYVVMNNETYGLTKGQASPTSQVGFEGNVEAPFDAILTALSIPVPNFIARTFSGDPKTMTQVFVEAIRFNRENRGFAFVEDLSPCVTYNDTFKDWRARIVDVATLPGTTPPTARRCSASAWRRCNPERSRSASCTAPLHPTRRNPGLELKLLPDKIGPARAEIGVEANRAAYEKLLRAAA